MSVRVRTCPSAFLVIFLATGSLSAQAIPAVAPAPGSATCSPRRPTFAVGEAILVNVVVNRFDALPANQDWARVDFESWTRNLNLGWEWDENAFGTNMFAHPYHGATYFNAGRSNCLSFWESVPLAFLGSWTWEFFGETHRPALNDFFMTSFGGIALGEITHRVAATIRDEQATGSGRLLRELAALPIDPVGSINRLLRGQWSGVRENPAEHDPGSFLFRLDVGARTLTEEVSSFRSTSPLLQADLRYGDALARAYHQPFDVFDIHVEVNPGGGGLAAIQGEGRLYQTDLTRADRRTRHALSISGRYDYLDEPVYRFGDQSIATGILSRWSLSDRTTLRTRLTGDLVTLGAIDSPFGGVGERDYDFGPGAGTTLELSLERNGKPIVVWQNRAVYLHTVSGATADHLIAFTRLEGRTSITDQLGAGIQLDGNLRRSVLKGGIEDEREFAELRIFLTISSQRAAAEAQP